MTHAAPQLSVSEALKARRIEIGMTINELAEALGVHRTTITRWEDGADPDELLMRRVRAFIDGRLLPNWTSEGRVALVKAEDGGTGQAPVDGRQAARKAKALDAAEAAKVTAPDLAAILTHAVKQGVKEALAESSRTHLQRDEKNTSNVALPTPMPELMVSPAMVAELAVHKEPVAEEGGLKQVGLTLTPRLQEELASEAKRLSLTNSEFVRCLLRSYLKSKATENAAA